MNALLIAWAISLIVIIGGTVYLQLSYDGADHVEEHVLDDQPSTNRDNNQFSKVDLDEAEEKNDTNSDVVTPLPEPQTPIPDTITSSDTSINAVDLALLEETRSGTVPAIAPDGRQPSLFYASPIKVDNDLPRIAIIITDIGRRSRQTQRALDTLPAAVTLAFSPYGTDLNKWSDIARQKGHESLLMIPMEPTNAAQNDAGPFALLTTNNSRQNLNLLRSSMSRLQGYVGVINHMGSRFTAVSDGLTPVMNELSARGLMFVDSRATQFSRAAEMSRALNIPTAINNAYIDNQPNQGAISTELTKLEGRARTLGASVGIIRAYPISINAVNEWAAGLKARGYQLVPITQVADRQPLSR
jgi:polysaccharide deacetylase 2 family uncharacterized protein YibQ